MLSARGHDLEHVPDVLVRDEVMKQVRHAVHEHATAPSPMAWELKALGM